MVSPYIFSHLAYFSFSLSYFFFFGQIPLILHISDYFSAHFGTYAGCAGAHHCLHHLDVTLVFGSFIFHLELCFCACCAVQTAVTSPWLRVPALGTCPSQQDIRRNE